jgi:hypothetical protein
MPANDPALLPREAGLSSRKDRNGMIARLKDQLRYGSADQQRPVDNILHLVDPDVFVKIVLKDDLPNTAAGKFRWVVNEYQPGPKRNRPE